MDVGHFKADLEPAPVVLRDLRTLDHLEDLARGHDEVSEARASVVLRNAEHLAPKSSLGLEVIDNHPYPRWPAEQALVLFHDVLLSLETAVCDLNWS
jgi:hypothetical protein